MTCNCLNKNLVEKEIYKEIRDCLSSRNYFPIEILIQLLQRFNFDVDNNFIGFVMKKEHMKALPIKGK